MQTDDKREELQARIAEDLSTLKSMLAQNDTLVQGYLRMIATGKPSEAREVLSLLTSITDNIHRLENLEQGSAEISYDELAYHSLGHAAKIFVAAQKGRTA